MENAFHGYLDIFPTNLQASGLNCNQPTELLTAWLTDSKCQAANLPICPIASLQTCQPAETAKMSSCQSFIHFKSSSDLFRSPGSDFFLLRRYLVGRSVAFTSGLIL